MMLSKRTGLRVFVSLVAILVVSCAWYSPIQSVANAQVDAGLKRALISFASARTLNALISVLQGTELSLQPFGMGLTLTLGQILDPINDLIEQFSSLMLLASVAFGIQKILLTIGAHWVISSLVSGVAVVWAGLHYFQRPSAFVSKLMLVLVMIRFAIPVVTIGSDFVFQNLLLSDYSESQKSLELVSSELGQHTPKVETSKPATPAPEKHWWEKLGDRVAAGLPNININYESIRKSAEQVPEKVIKLIVVFLMQTMIIPIILLWGLYKVTFGAVRTT